MKSIRYCIDNFKVNDQKTEVEINGWAFDEQNEDVNIDVIGMKILKHEVIERYDIYHHFNEAEKALNSGFKIVVPYNKKLKIKFYTSNCEMFYKLGTDRELKPANGNKITDVIYNKFVYIMTIVNPYNLVKAFKYVKDYGVIDTLRKIKNMFFKKKDKTITYDEWVIKHRVNTGELEKQRKHRFNNSPKISIITDVNLSNQEKNISAMLDSVVKQSYSNFELCIIIGRNSSDEKVNLFNKYSGQHENIKIIEVENNLNKADRLNEGIKQAGGDFIGILESSDVLELNCLYEIVKYINDNNKAELIYSDEDRIDMIGKKRFDVQLKPDWSPDTFRSHNYIGYFTVFSKELLNRTGLFNSVYVGSEYYDLLLRLTENAEMIGHVAKVLYHHRVNEEVVEEKEEITSIESSDKKALQDHLSRIGEEAIVKDGLISKTYKIDYEIKDNPLVSIIIPNKDEAETLKVCIDSVLEKSTYKNIEIIIVENNSTSEEIFEYYKEVEKIENVKVVTWEREFNYSAINNFGIKYSKGEYVILLNNDIEVITPNWIEEMLMNTQRKEVGITGVKLYYPDDTIQHAGVIIGINSVAGHSHGKYSREDNGYMGRLKIVQNLSAVTAACLMIKRSILEEIDGLDEEYPVAFNDVDLCLRVREKGYLIVFTPFVEMYHYESKSRGSEDTPEKLQRFKREVDRFKHRWGLWRRDPYYNDNLTREKEDFSLRA